MKIGILGTGVAGQTIGTKLSELGHQVMLGSRESESFKNLGWMEKRGSGAGVGTFNKAALFGELVFNCTAGVHSLEALEMAGQEALSNKIIVDVANPLDFSKGLPPTLAFCNTESLGERIQSAYPKAYVVKTLNTVNAYAMVNPGLIPGDHTIFVSGNEAKAKAEVVSMLKNWFGWKSIIDLGDITAARAMEMYLPLWLRLMQSLDNPMFNIRVIQGEKPDIA